MDNRVSEFEDYRSRMNQKILQTDNLVIKRLFHLDSETYKEGALNSKTKEMIGLAASMVLRCDDCVKYHLQKCHQARVSNQEVFEVFAIVNIIGGTIVIPHLRRAVEFWEALQND